MSKTKSSARMNREDCRACFTIIGFVYSPLVILVAAAALIGLG